jgi:hypothetical protein
MDTHQKLLQRISCKESTASSKFKSESFENSSIEQYVGSRSKSALPFSNFQSNVLARLFFVLALGFAFLKRKVTFFQSENFVNIIIRLQFDGYNRQIGGL